MKILCKLRELCNFIYFYLQCEAVPCRFAIPRRSRFGQPSDIHFAGFCLLLWPLPCPCSELYQVAALLGVSVSDTLGFKDSANFTSIRFDNQISKCLTVSCFSLDYICKRANIIFLTHYLCYFSSVILCPICAFFNPGLCWARGHIVGLIKSQLLQHVAAKVQGCWC